MSFNIPASAEREYLQMMYPAPDETDGGGEEGASMSRLYRDEKDSPELGPNANLRCECDHAESEHSEPDYDYDYAAGRYIPDPRPCRVDGCECRSFFAD